MDWKADQIAIDNYPSWYGNHVQCPKKDLIKKEAPENEDKRAIKGNGKRPPEPAAPSLPRYSTEHVYGLCLLEQ
ncbi:hypothetical protein SERLA73DRAFT_80894 [Serpula lacrymans var. lacrymans S7.3]|uniref:Uncharacterized protein n=1 Tax=Serpula lacrymans var. lacrymans (strain S7.3) TaxID=936435 RepID=F8QKF8_SERL3|nr:hypothetical protein SERLA73DRAFT_80894 [Serpula lacrymans var. lacrymans S7.3]